MAITTQMRESVMELYTAYFNRAADRDGVDYWLNEMDKNGWSIDMVAQSFADQTEYTNLYGGMTNAQIVSQVYNNVLNRDADAAGAAYWESELNKGTFKVNQLIQAVVNAAKEDVDNLGDDNVLANKNAVSQYCYDHKINQTDISLALVTQEYGSINDIITYIYEYIELGDTPHQELLSADMQTLVSLVSLDTYSGELTTTSIREEVIASMGSDAYYEAFDPKNYEGSEDGVFTTEELGFSHLSNLPATTETVESLFYGTIIKAYKSIDMGEILSIESFVDSHEADFMAGNEDVFNELTDLVVNAMISSTSSPILEDSEIFDIAVMAGELFVEAVSIGDNPALFEGIFMSI